MPRPANQLPALDEVAKRFTYNPVTGDLIWNIDRTRSIKAGSVAGSVHKVTGYRYLRINGVEYAAHRVAWLLATGESLEPSVQIDHVNGDKDDNRICNLRKCGGTQNSHNSRRRTDNKSGVKGVHWLSRIQRWRAQIGLKGKIIHIGDYRTREEAAQNIKIAREALHGEFANHG